MSALFTGTIWQRVKLISGLILFVFAGTHFINHALGLIDLNAMNEFQSMRKSITRSLPGSIILIAALLLHPILALGKLWYRSSWRMPLWEAAQVLSGIAIPLLLIPHVVFTRVAWTMFGATDSYGTELSLLWPGLAWDQSILLLIVWVHGCIGLHYWLRLAHWYQRVQTVLLVLAVALPILSLAGFTTGARFAINYEFGPTETYVSPEPIVGLTGAQKRKLSGYSKTTKITFLVLLTGLVGWHLARLGIALVRRGAQIKLTYRAGPMVRLQPGPTLLEISRANDIPHASVCGGRGRCTTCRVSIEEGLGDLPPPVDVEAAALKKINAPDNIRLACQIRPSGNMTVLRMINATAAQKIGPVAGISRAALEQQSTEKRLAVLFLDVRGFTQIAENKLPYDVVFILNQFFSAVGQAIASEAGVIDKYMGDGLMAIFGQGTDAATGCAQALRAAKKIDKVLARVSSELDTELAEPLRIGIGIHVGRLVIGRIGHDETAPITVIGNAVNTASRLEQMTKDFDCQLIASRRVLALAGYRVEDIPVRSVEIRGMARPLDAVVFKHAGDIADVPRQEVRQDVGEKVEK